MRWLMPLTVLALAFVLVPSGQANALRMQHIIRSVFGSGWLGATMNCIAWRESTMHPWASNWTDSNGGSHGLFQINGIWRTRGETPRHFAIRMHNPWNNVRMARRLYLARGLEPWGGDC